MEINELAAALAKAQAEFPTIPKTGVNPHLKNAYSTLDDVIGSTRLALTKHGLSFVQLLGNSEDGTTSLRTILMHESGQSLESTVRISMATEHRGINAMQALGAAITYMKRYSLTAMLGVGGDIDTDGNDASKPAKRTTRQAPTPERAEPLPDNGGITSPKALYEAVQAETLHFNSIPHMLSTIRKVNNDTKWQWPTPNDVNVAQLYADAKGILLDYAEANAVKKQTGE